MFPHRTADIGILVGDKNYWGLGMGQDAWDTFGNWLLNFGGMRKITGGTVSGNAAMIRIMERFGMIREAVRYKQQIFDGITHDVLYYAKFNE
jgi:RimJ/RimL family protein N-acetyltransferase